MTPAAVLGLTALAVFIAVAYTWGFTWIMRHTDDAPPLTVVSAVLGFVVGVPLAITIVVAFCVGA